MNDFFSGGNGGGGGFLAEDAINATGSNGGEFVRRTNTRSHHARVDQRPTDPIIPRSVGALPRSGRSSEQQKEKNESLRPVTIKQLNDAEVTPQDDHLVSGDIISSIVLCGKITRVAESNTLVKYEIHDGTGRAEVRLFHDPDELGAAGAEAEAKAELREGVYARVFGRLAKFGPESYIQAFKMRPITDMNEMTFHMLQAIYAHVSLSQANGTALNGKRVSALPAPNSLAASTGGAAQGAETNTMGLDPCQKAAFDMCINEGLEEVGMSFQQLQAKLGGRFTAKQLRDACTHLSNSGFIYTTVDEDHFKGIEQ